MFKRKSKPANRLGGRLRKLVSSINVDLFGVEDSVLESTKAYFEEISEATGHPTTKVRVRISDRKGRVQAQVYCAGTFHAELEIADIAKIFSGKSAVANQFLQQRIETGIVSCLKDLSGEFLDALGNSTTVQLSLLKEKPTIQVFHDHQYRKDLRVNDLVKYFM